MNNQTQHQYVPDESMLPDEARIRALLEEILEKDMRPEQLSGGNLKLERELRERLKRRVGSNTNLRNCFLVRLSRLVRSGARVL